VAVFAPRPDEAAALEGLGAGAHTFSFSFVLPAVAADRAGLLDLRLSHAPVDSLGASGLSIQLNGAAVAQVPLNAANQEDALVRVRPGGALLRPGLNTLTLGFRLPADDSSAVRQWARLGPGIRLVLPPPPLGEAGLESLPGRIFDSPGGLRVLVEQRDDAWLSASARLLAALGRRSTEVPGVEVASPGQVRPSSLVDRSAIAIGVEAVAAVDHRAGGRLGGPWRSASRPPQSGSGTVYEQSLGDGPARGVLCLATGTPEVVAAAAAALHRHTLRGPAMGLDAAGVSWSVRPDPVTAPSGADTLVVLRVLFALAIAAMLVAVGCQVVRPGEAGVAPPATDRSS
jgi:hypothetical protein